MKTRDSIDWEGSYCSNHHYYTCETITFHSVMNRSEGLLGVITRVAIQTQRLPKFVDVCLVQCSSFDRVIQTYVSVTYTLFFGCSTTIPVRRYHIYIYLYIFFFFLIGILLHVRFWGK